MSIFKFSILFIFAAMAHIAFAELCQQSHDQAAVFCNVDDYQLPSAADSFEDRSATTAAAANIIGQVYARCNAAVDSCKSTCRAEYENAKEIDDTEKMDSVIELSSDCARGDIASMHATISRDKIAAQSLARSALVQRTIATSPNKNNRADRTSGVSSGLTTMPTPLLGTLIGL